MQQIVMAFDDTKDNAEYQAFVDKFKPKKTTDDCYTPPNVYDAVADWVAEEYDANRDNFVRPFYPGGDYENFDYPDGCVVVDNPPFSIITKIVRFYMSTGVRFFLFAPTLTLFGGKVREVCYIPVGADITYENGAKVNTSFVTNLDEFQMRSAPELYRCVKIQNDINENARTAELPKYSYPDQVLTAAAAYRYSHYGVDFRLRREDCMFISAMDEQKKCKKGIFGGGLLLSNAAAAERAAAERTAATKWELSTRELEIIKGLGGDG